MKEEDNKWRLGQTSSWYETQGRGAGAVSSGVGDYGGVSYGEFQLSTNTGTTEEYVKQSKYREDFEGLNPETIEFSEKWKELAQQDGFAQDQYEFIKRTHYDVELEALRKKGLDLAGRGPAVQDALWSTSVQTRGLTVKIFEEGLKERFGDEYQLEKLTDKDIVEAVQDYKYSHTNTIFRHSYLQWEGLRSRALQEKADLIQLAETGVPVDTIARARSTSRASHERALHHGSYGNDVKHIQERLIQLGYTDAKGQAIHADGSFGPATRYAVESFQRDRGLDVDGIAGLATQGVIDAAMKESHRAMAALSPSSPTFADPDHPQHAVYAKLKEVLPVGTSEARLVQFTSACHLAGMDRPEDISAIHIGKSEVVFMPRSLIGVPASIDLLEPAPAVQASMQQAQAYDQQCVQSLAQFQVQQQQINAQVQQGPVLGGPSMQ